MRIGERRGSSRRRGIGVAIRLVVLGLGLGAAQLASAAEMAPDPVATLRAIEDAVARGDLAAAERLSRSLHTRALASRRWADWLAAGDAALAVGRGAPQPGLLRATARQAYLAALFQARGQRSLRGVLRAAEAFAQLGDHDIVEGALRIAAQMPGASEASEIERIRLVTDRLRRLARRDTSNGRIEP
jgi:hypothetical protein